MLQQGSIRSCIHAVRFLNIAVPYCRSVLLESGGDLPRGLPCVITGTVLEQGSVDDRSVWAEFSKLFKANCSVILPFSEYGLKCKTVASKRSPFLNTRVLLFPLVPFPRDYQSFALFVKTNNQYGNQIRSPVKKHFKGQPYIDFHAVN